MLRGQRRVVVYAAQPLNRGGGLKPITILNGDVASKTALAVFEVKARDTERVNVIFNDLRAADDTQNQVGGGVVALRDS